MTVTDPTHTASNTPIVSIIVLNYNGLRHLQPCFTSLEQLDYPTDKLELLLVDNGSTDGSLDYLAANHVRVRIVKSPSNLGFAEGNNLGVRAAKGEIVLLLNNDMRVDPGLVRGMLDVLLREPVGTCVGAKILDWDGQHIDFADAAAHFAGFAYQPGHGDPHTSNTHQDIKPLLYACGGALMLQRQTFLDVGGFDSDYFAYYEDLDLGWRLWVLGHRVLLAPKAIVYHRHHGTSSKMNAFRREVLYKRNALYTILKNYQADNLPRIIAATLFGTVDGVVGQSAQHGHLRPNDFAITNTRRSLGSGVLLEKRIVASLVAIYQVSRNLRKVMDKRAIIQTKRKRTDAEIAPLFKMPFGFWPGVSPQAQYRVVDAFDVQRIFADAPRRVLVISSDILPYAGLPTVGSGLRAWGLGQGLKTRGHEVLFSMPRAVLDKHKANLPADVRALAWEPHTLVSIVKNTNPGMVVVCNWPIMELMQTEFLDVPVILDQHGPHLLEREFQKFGDMDENRRVKLSALRKADFFTCAGDKQLDYFQDWLREAGWNDAERAERVAAMPISLSPELPAHDYTVPDDGPTFVYGGVFLPWQNPIVGLSALVDVLDRRQHGHLKFFGGRHPVYPVDPGKFDTILEQISKSTRVSAPGMIPHAELVQIYTKAHVAIDVMERNRERELAFTTRTVEYLWCGLPVIYNDYSELSDYIARYDAGWIVDPDDREAITRVIEHILDHPEEARRKGENAQRLARECFAWDKTIAPLDAFIRTPRMRHHDYPTVGTLTQLRTARYLMREARLHLKRSGVRGLWTEGTAFVRRQFGARG